MMMTQASELVLQGNGDSCGLPGDPGPFEGTTHPWSSGAYLSTLGWDADWAVGPDRAQYMHFQGSGGQETPTEKTMMTGS